MANSPARSTVDVGSVIAETFTIEALIGRGGMGSVFLASHNRLPGKFVAIKLLHTELDDPEVLSRFKREAHIASQLNHPNIVTVHDHNVTEDGTPYLVLEHLQGVSLAQRLRDQGSLPLEQVFSIVRQVGSALAAAHRGGIVHRDLKPANIFLVPTEVDGRGVEIAKVLDFGISKIRGSQTVKTQESTLLGTPQYMAPEQAKGEHTAVDDRTDIFAFGAIVYEMLAGHPAFAGETIPEVVFKVVYEPPLALAKQAPSVPLAIVAAVEQAMAKRPDDRFANVSAFVEAMTGTPVSQFRTPALPPLSDGLDTAPSRGRSTGQDAFAQTMNSLDVDVPEAKSATVVSNAAIVLPQDIQTIATAPPAPPRSSLKLVIVGVAAAAIAVTVMYLVMRTPGGGAATIDAGAPIAAIAPDAAVRDAGVDAVPIDAAIVAAA
ncbi:MAG: serine/threonine-protein kinase, partial [Kofleriaceae bacterium]